jgi:hypothetical protein
MAEHVSTCAHCNVQMEIKAGRGRPKRFCSQKCSATVRARAKGVIPADELRAIRRQKALITCEHCGTGFVQGNNYSRYGVRKTRKFCSQQCYLESLTPSFDGDPKIRSVWFRNCTECHKHFVARYESTQQCSSSCKSRSYSKKKFIPSSVNCNECGDAFVPEYGDKRRGFCGASCASRFNRRLRSNRIKSLPPAMKESFSPFAVFNRDGWSCVACGIETPKALRGTYEPNAPELDHIVPLSKGGFHTMANTQCLCRSCNADKSDLMPDVWRRGVSKVSKAA